MGKVTGFMEYERLEEGYEPVAARIKNYKEFVIGLNVEQAKQQGARCMDCGTPFCNNGCPVNNVIGRVIVCSSTPAGASGGCGGSASCGKAPPPRLRVSVLLRDRRRPAAVGGGRPLDRLEDALNLQPVREGG